MNEEDYVKRSFMICTHQILFGGPDEEERDGHGM